MEPNGVIANLGFVDPGMNGEGEEKHSLFMSESTTLNLHLREMSAMTLATSDFHSKDYGGFGGKVSYNAHLFQVRELVNACCTILGITGVPRNNLLCAAWLHDSMEERGYTYNDISKVRAFNAGTAELVYCVTGHGRNREERWEQKRELLLRNHHALLLFVCDRISNYSVCIRFAGAGKRNRQLLNMYNSEAADVQSALVDARSYTLTVEDRWEQRLTLSHLAKLEAWYRDAHEYLNRRYGDKDAEEG
jgi:hypothetical protein